jgi:2-methylisocitrate lyase-like PEP mutase family enzyme
MPSSLKQLLTGSAETGLIVPGCYDRVSAALVQSAGFPAAVLSGGSIQGSFAGFSDDPDLTDFVAATAHVAAAISVPLIVDGEDGFGRPVEALGDLLDAGAAGVHVEDYSVKSGELVDAATFAHTVTAMSDSLVGRDGSLLIRTDGLRNSAAEAIDRAKRYVDCGDVDAVIPFLGPLLAPESKPELLEFLDQLASAVAVPVVAYAPLGHELSIEECTSVGVRILLVPHLLLGSAVAAVERALRVVADRDAASQYGNEIGAWDLSRLRALSS